MAITAFPFRGTAMVPGVSLNRRLYTAEVIGKAVRRAQERIDSGAEPLTMLTHHGAEDDSTRIVGRITRIWQESDGRARYTAVLAGTDEARNIRNLIAPDGEEVPFLDGVSIRGWWLGEVRAERGPDGDVVSVADDLELDGLDFTKTPGILGARVEAVGDDAEETGGRVLIYESATVDPPAAPKTPTRSPYADLGYRGARRFPLDSPAAARRSWERVNDPTETAGYTPAQLKRMRSRTQAALKEHGVAMPKKPVKTTFGKAEEFYAEDGGDAGLSVCAYNGPLTITVSAYGIDAEQLQQVADKAMAAAMDAVAALDDAVPDDAPEEEPEDEPADDAPADDDEAEDDQMETGRKPGAVTEKQRPRTPAAATTRREPTVAPTNPAAPTGGVHLTDEQFTQLLAKVGTPATEAALAEPVIEETAEEKQARIIGETVKKAVDEAVGTLRDDLTAQVQAAGPRRKGFTAKTAEALKANEPTKPLHEMSTEDFNKTAEQGFAAAFGIDLGE